MKYRQVINPITGQFNLVPEISVLNFKPAVDTYEDLPITGNTKGDARFVKDTNRLYVWGIEASEGQLTDWIDIGDIIDINWDTLEGKPASPPAEIDDAVSKKHTQNTDTILRTSTGELINDGLLKSPLILDAETGCNSIFLRPSSTKDPQRKFYMSVGGYIGDNSVFCIGWNAVAHTGPIDGTEPSLSYSIESNYHGLFEMHWRHYWYEGEILNFREPGSMVLQRFGKHKSIWRFRDSLEISDYSEEGYPIGIFYADKDIVSCTQPLDVRTSEDELIARFHRYEYSGILEIRRREDSDAIKVRSLSYIGYDYLANLVFDARQFRFYTPVGSQIEENFYFDGGWVVFRNYDTKVDIAAIVNRPDLIGLGYNITRLQGLCWKAANEEKNSTLICLSDHEIKMEGSLTPGGSDWICMLHVDLIDNKFLIPHSATKVGIRTDNPTEALDVNGDVNIRGLLKTNGEEGTEGQVLTRTEDGIAWLDPTGGGNGEPGSGWVKIFETEIDSADDIIVSGVDGDKDKYYMFVIEGYMQGPDIVERIIGIRPNGDDGEGYALGLQHGVNRAVDYDHFFGWAGNTRRILPICRNAYAGWSTSGEVFAIGCMKAETGRIRSMFSKYFFKLDHSSSALDSCDLSNAWYNTQDNITSLTIHFDGLVNFEGRLRIYALK